MSTIVNVKTILQPDGFILNKAKLSIHFHGDSFAQVQDLPAYIPVRISIHVDERWPGLSPVVHTIPQGPLNPAMFPFLPVRRGFEPKHGHDWQRLAMNIQQDLLAVPHFSATNPECYLFMQELFWMAFVAAFPTFPHGDWPIWDPRIPMEGDFISQWVSKDSDELEVADLSGRHLNALRRSIWEQFVMAIEETLLISATS